VPRSSAAAVAIARRRRARRSRLVHTRASRASPVAVVDAVRA